MNVKSILVAFLILLSIAFIGLQFLEYKVQADGVKALLLVFLTSLYCSKVNDKQLFFFLFLITFTIAEILNFGSYFVSDYYDKEGFYAYYLVNGLCILAYIFLIIRITLKMNIPDVIRKFPMHIIVLIVLDVFCVTIITTTAENQFTTTEYLVEYAYNAIIMILLSFALMNFIYKDDKKSVNMLIGSIFIVFSEVIQLTYFYISDMNLLSVIYSMLLILAFLFFYLQSRIPFNNQKDLFNPHLRS